MDGETRRERWREAAIVLVIVVMGFFAQRHESVNAVYTAMAIAGSLCVVGFVFHTRPWRRSS